MKQGQTLRVGIIGAGAISREHANSVNGYGDAKVMAVADLSAKRARALAADCKIPRVYASAEALLADRELDAVTICVPNRFHAPYAVAALGAGLHVLLDKPFALNAGEAARVLAAARASRKVFTVGMNWRFMEPAQVLREIVRRGDLGEVYHGKAVVMRRSGSPKFGTWFCRKDMAGGGALLDIGVHFLDLCLYLMDNFEPAAVSGATYCKLGPRGLGEGGWGLSDRGKFVFDVDDLGTALIKMKNGATVCLDASWVLHQENPDRVTCELFGTEGGASVRPLKLFRFGRKKGEYEVTVPQGVRLRYPHANRFHNWLDAIFGRDELAATPAQVMAVQKILDAIYESAKTGRETRIR